MQANWLWGFDQFIGDLTGDGKMNQDEFKVVVEEVARIALEDQRIRDYIGNQLDLSDEELETVYQRLEAMLNEEQA